MTKFTTVDKPDLVEGNGELSYSNDDYAFANTVIQSIKRQQRLPLQLKAADVFGVMHDMCPYWYEHWPDATVEDQLTFSTDCLANPNKYLDAAGVDKRFRLHTNEVLMPNAVFGIYELFYTAGGYVNRSLLNYAQWQLDFLLLSNTGFGTPLLGVDYYLGSVYCLNLLTSLSKEPVAHQYNKDSHVLRVYDLGTRGGYITAKVARCVAIQNFYNNPYFRMLIIAHVLQARADSIDFVGATLPGDLQVNTGVLRDRANTLLEQFNRQLESEEQSDFYAIKS